MNDKDNPFGLGGGGERTVIRPNPGGRLPQQQRPLTLEAPATPSPAGRQDRKSTRLNSSH